MRLILDNLPITTNDLEGFPENIRPGYQVCFDNRLSAASQALPHAVFEHIHSKPSCAHSQVGYEEGGKYYINNHLMIKILVHKTNGQYTRARANMAEIEAAAVIEVLPPHCCHVHAEYKESSCQHWIRNTKCRLILTRRTGW